MFKRLMVVLSILVMSLFGTVTAEHVSQTAFEFDESIAMIEITLDNVKTGESEYATCTAFIADNIVFTAAHCFNWLHSIQPDVDISIIRSADETEKSLKICTTPPHIGDDIIQIGYPHWAQGAQHRAYGKIIRLKENLIVTDTTGYQGESGGPLISVDDDCVFGVYSGIFIEHKTRRSFSVITTLMPIRFMLGMEDLNEQLHNTLSVTHID